MMINFSSMILVLFFILAGIIPAGAAAAEQDLKGSMDHPLLSRMPGFYISQYKESEFDSYHFVDKDGKRKPVEGHFYRLRYTQKNGAVPPGELKIRRNVQEAIKKIGGTVLFDNNFNRMSTMVVKKDKKETWIEVSSYPSLYDLVIVEKEMMKQEVVADAAAMGSGLRSDGHIPLYGIFFDTGKSEIKPESDDALAEIAKLLKNEASLSLYVVGHTDNDGSFDFNMKLSKDRADAVVKDLSVKYVIAASRLKAYGVASLSPIASNDTEEGKAKNRRVELVKQ